MGPKRKLAAFRTNDGERGFVLVTVSVSAIALMLAIGLSVDIGRMFISKNETQTFTDAGAIAAALLLDGTDSGITAARAAVTSSVNKWHLDSTTVASPTVTFATSAAGPWVATPAPATGYNHVKVLASVPQPLYFMPVVVSRYTQNVASLTVAGQVPVSYMPRGLAPFTAVSTNTTGPYFGLNIGASYDIQWPQFNGERAGCTPSNPERCFNSDPCSGDPSSSKQAVVSNWGSNTSGYWGSNSNSIIQQEVLDLIQLQPVDVGTNIAPVLSNGTKASEAGYLDERVNQDINTTVNTVAGYLATAHNGRRLISVPIVNPISPTRTDVIGYGAFLLLANGPGTSDYYTRNTHGNDPFCALYAGTYIIGGTGPGTGGTTGASTVKVVQ